MLSFDLVAGMHRLLEHHPWQTATQPSGFRKKSLALQGSIWIDLKPFGNPLQGLLLTTMDGNAAGIRSVSPNVETSMV